jgi:hypothetical protein
MTTGRPVVLCLLASAVWVAAPLPRIDAIKNADPVWRTYFRVTD